MKTCSKCGILKDFSDFNKSARTRDGYERHCKACERERARRYRQSATHQAALKLRKTRFFDKNPDYNKEYYRNNKDQLREQQRKYYDTHKDAILLQHYQYIKEKCATNSLFKITKNIRSLISLSFRKKGFGKGVKTAEILGIDFEGFSAHLLHSFEAFYGRPYSPDADIVHIDHIKPLITATTEEEIIALNHYTNLQLLLAVDNLEKRAKLDWVLLNSTKGSEEA